MLNFQINQRLDFIYLCLLAVCLQVLAKSSSHSDSAFNDDVNWAGWPDTKDVSEITALVDYTTGLIFYKDISVPACFVENHHEHPHSINRNTHSSLPKVLAVSNKLHKISTSDEWANSLYKEQFCGSLPTYRIESLEEETLKRGKRLPRNKRQANERTYSGSQAQASRWPSSSQTQVQGSVAGQGFFSGQAQAAHGGFSQSQVQLGGQGITGNLQSSAGNAQSQLSLGEHGGGGQASSFGLGPSNSQVQVNLGQREQGSHASANVFQQHDGAGSGSGHTSGHGDGQGLSSYPAPTYGNGLQRRLPQGDSQDYQQGHTSRRNGYVYPSSNTGQLPGYGSQQYTPSHQPHTYSAGGSSAQRYQQPSSGYDRQSASLGLPSVHGPPHTQSSYDILPGTQQGYDRVAPIPGTHSGLDRVAPLPGVQPGYDRVAPLPGAQPGYDRVAPLPGAQPGYDRVAPLPGIQPGYDRVAPLPGYQPGHDRVAPLPGIQSGYDRTATLPGTQNIHDQNSGLDQTDPPEGVPVRVQPQPVGPAYVHPGSLGAQSSHSGSSERGGQSYPSETGSPATQARNYPQRQTPATSSVGNEVQPGIQRGYDSYSPTSTRDSGSGRQSQSQGIYIGSNVQPLNENGVHSSQSGDHRRRHGHGNGSHQRGSSASAYPYTNGNGGSSAGAGAGYGAYASAPGGQAQAQSLHIGSFGGRGTNGQDYSGGHRQTPYYSTAPQGSKAPKIPGETPAPSSQGTNGYTNGYGQRTHSQTNGHRQSSHTGHSAHGNGNGHRTQGTNGHTTTGINGHRVPDQRQSSQTHGTVDHESYRRIGHVQQNGNGHHGTIPGQTQPSRRNGQGYGTTSTTYTNGNGKPENGQRNGHSISVNGYSSGNGNGHRAGTNGNLPQPQYSNRQPGTNGNALSYGTNGSAATQLKPKPQCTMITFTCTIVIESNGRAKLCRPKTTTSPSTSTNGGGGGGGANTDQTVCCC